VRGFLDEHLRRGGRYEDIAVLYRTNAQSRAFETELRHRGIPYEIVGGVAFYQRREVKDVLAYLRLLANPADAVSFFRIWNTPRRGLGPAVRVLLEERAARDGIPPLEGLRALVREDALRGTARVGARELLALLDELAAMAAGPLEALVRRLLEGSRYLEHLAEGDETVDRERRANVEELANAAVAYASASGGTLADFLAETSLLTDADRIAEGADRVLLLTAHNAKGLEFPKVVVAGLEEGLFPHASSSEDASGLEEERRLFYVALTRARDEVLLTAAAWRRRFDAARGGQVSRFVGEIPAELLEHEEPEGVGEWNGARRAGVRRRGDGDEVALPTRGRTHRAVGREVFHESFGRGRVLAADGEGGDARVTVQFAAGVKKILGRFLTGGSDDDPA
jgi:DNA helicase-2/ATP-dependent DNA helicase PcrA